MSKPRWVGGFATEAAAKRARDEARIAASTGGYVDRSTVTVGDYLSQWLAAQALEVKPRTRAGYAHLIETYVVPRIGGLRLQAVTSADLSRLYRDLLEGGGRDGRPLSGRSVEYVHAVLRKAFADAVRTDQLLSSNPAERAKRPRKDVAQPVVMWTAGDLAAFLASTQGHRLHAFFWLAAATGARRGELVNLRWADVHLGDTLSREAPSVRLRGSVSVINGVRVEGSTKGGRERVVSIDPETAAVLQNHRAAQDRERVLAAGSWVDDPEMTGGGHVFRQELGAPLFPDTPTALMRKLLNQHNRTATGPTAEPTTATAAPRPLLVIRLHDLRHLHASLLLKAGVPVHVVAHRLGHADPSITLRVYAHVLDDQASHAATAFAAILHSRQGDS
ncbi:MAG: tyrosine-type recombinase/integrase [Lapillicoccus sp.]